MNKSNSDRRDLLEQGGKEVVEERTRKTQSLNREALREKQRTGEFERKDIHDKKPLIQGLKTKTTGERIQAYQGQVVARKKNLMK